MSVASLLAFPLFARELTERAARRRTYALRVGYGLMLYAIFVWTVRNFTGSAGLGALGIGRELLHRLVDLECWGILLFQPALMAGVITSEKERESFHLLILAGMRPSKILLEKLAAGLLPMATLLLLALPLGAITMGYGGVSLQLLAAGGLVVLAAWLATGAFALLCSAWCRTTVGAMLTAYIAGACILLAPPFIFSMTTRYVLWNANLTGFEVPQWVWALWPPEAFARVLAFQQSQAALAQGGALFTVTLRECTPMLAAAGVFLVLARLVLMPRAMVGRTVRIKSGAKQKSKTTPAVRRDLPADEPVAWRESGRGLLGRRAEFFRNTAMCCAIVLALSLFLLALYPKTAAPERLHHLALILGAAAVLVLTVRSVGSLLVEHSNQTLDILLTTPLGAGEILVEKARALGRHWLLFGLMLGIVFAMQGWAEFEYVRTRMFIKQLGQYWIVAALTLLVYPRLIIWVSLFLAMWLRRRARAIAAALFVFGTWFLVPMMLLAFAMPDWRATASGLWLSLLSPLGILDANEHDRLAYFAITQLPGKVGVMAFGAPIVPVLVNFIFYGALGWLARFACMRWADRLLRK
jgi:hypothetical protein